MSDAIGLWLGGRTAVVAAVRDGEPRIVGSFERQTSSGDVTGWCDMTFGDAKRIAEEALGTKVRRAVVAVPMGMPDELRPILRNLALAEFEQIEFLGAAVAIALAFPFDGNDLEIRYILVCHRDERVELTLLARTGSAFTPLESDESETFVPHRVFSVLNRAGCYRANLERVIASGFDEVSNRAERGVMRKEFGPERVAWDGGCAPALGAALRAASSGAGQYAEVKTAPVEPPEPFELQRLLGAGSFFQTYKASVRDPLLRQRWGRGIVAVKIPLSKKKERQLRGDVGTFWHSHGAIRSPHLVTPLAFMPFRGQLVMVVPFIPGTSLRYRLRNLGRPVPLDEWMPIARDVLMALAVVHAEGSAHRNVSPDNIFFGQTSAQLDHLEAHPVFEDPGEPVCTSAYYAAPELLEGGRKHSAASDVWAFGVTFHEALTGLRPFDGKSFHETLGRIQNAEYKAPASFDTRVVEALTRMLAADPAARPSVTSLLAQFA